MDAMMSMISGARITSMASDDDKPQAGKSDKQISYLFLYLARPFP